MFTENNINNGAQGIDLECVMEGITLEAIDGVELFETDGFDYAGQAVSPDFQPDTAFEFATNQ